jgi:hypothetical protein
VNRPTLIPGLPRVWRGPGELQLGSDPARALLLHLPDPRLARVLDLLDGSRSESLVLMRAAEMGVSAADCRALLDTLGSAGLALPAPALIPLTLPAEAQRRLVGEAAALALRRSPLPPLAPLPVSSAAFAPPGTFAPPAAALPPAVPSPIVAAPPVVPPRAAVPSAAAPSTAAPSAAAPSAAAPPPVSADSAVLASHAVPRQTVPPLVPALSAALALPVPPAQILRSRLGARVVVTGRGRLGSSIAVALAEAGIGHVYPDIPGAVGVAELPGGPLSGSDIGRPRCDAITDAVSRAAPMAATHAVRRWPVTLVVQLDHEQPVSLLAAAHMGRSQPYLAVTIRDGTAVVGPLVPVAGVPCLNCLDLDRRERDARWPSQPPGQRREGIEPCTVTTLLAATAFAAAEVLAYIDGERPETVGATVEITAPGRMRRRTWPAHPACPCGRPEP